MMSFKCIPAHINPLSCGAMKGLVTLFCLLIIHSCAESKRPFYPENIEELTFELEGKKWEYDTLKSPYRLFLVKDFLFVSQDKKVNYDEPMIHAFDKTTLAHIGALGKNGMGPNEMLYASHLDMDSSDSTMLVFDGINKRISKFDFAQLGVKNLLSNEQITLSSNMFDAIKTYKASDSTYLSISTQKKYMFNEYDLKGNWINGYGLWPEPTNDKLLSGFSGMERNFLLIEINAAWYRKKMGGHWYGLAMVYRDRVELFNYKTKELKSIEGPELIEEIQPFKIAGSGSSLSGAYGRDAQYTYRDLVFKDKNIYALYGGHSQVDYQETGIVAKTIFVFSYDGQLIGKLLLDRSVVALEVDEELGKIYTTTTDEDPGIAVFDLPEVFLGKRKDKLE